MGHRLTPKTEDTIRILFHNVNGIGTDASSQIAQHKLGKLKKIVLNHKVDVIGLAEYNVDWRTQKESLADRFNGWFSHKKSAAPTTEALVETSRNHSNQVAP